MTDLTDFIGTSGLDGDELVYIVDGVQMPDSSGKFSIVTSVLAQLVGGGFDIGDIALISGSLSLGIKSDGTGKIAVVYEIMEGDKQMDVANVTYTVDSTGTVLELVGTYTDMGPFTASIQRVDDGANTQIAAAFQNFFDGKTITAVLEPKS